MDNLKVFLNEKQRVVEMNKLLHTSNIHENKTLNPMSALEEKPKTSKECDSRKLTKKWDQLDHPGKLFYKKQ